MGNYKDEPYQEGFNATAAVSDYLYMIYLNNRQVSSSIYKYTLMLNTDL